VPCSITTVKNYNKSLETCNTFSSRPRPGPNTKCSRPRPRLHDPRPGPRPIQDQDFLFLSSRRLETKTLWSLGLHHWNLFAVDQIKLRRFSNLPTLFCLLFSCPLLPETRSSADADNLRDAFSGQSRSTNMVPFRVHCDFSLSM